METKRMVLMIMKDTCLKLSSLSYNVVISELFPYCMY